MQTMNEHERTASLMYYGERGEWFLAASSAECSDVVTRANFIAFQRALPADSFAVEGYGGAFGHGEWLLIDPDRADALEVADAILCDLCDYPVIDDEVLSELEYDEALEAAALGVAETFGSGGLEDAAARFVLAYDEARDAGIGYSEHYWPTPKAVFFGYLAARRAAVRA